MSNPKEEKDMQEENRSAYGVGPDETQAMSASGRGFDSPLPHSPPLSSNSVIATELGAAREHPHSDIAHLTLLTERPCF
jgi:hypothetical protein